MKTDRKTKRVLDRAAAVRMAELLDEYAKATGARVTGVVAHIIVDAADKPGVHHMKAAAVPVAFQRHCGCPTEVHAAQVLEAVQQSAERLLRASAPNAVVSILDEFMRKLDELEEEHPKPRKRAAALPAHLKVLDGGKSKKPPRAKKLERGPFAKRPKKS